MIPVCAILIISAVAFFGLIRDECMIPACAVLTVSAVDFFGVSIVTIVMSRMRCVVFWMGLKILLGILIFVFVATLIDVTVSMIKAKKRLKEAIQTNDTEQIEISEYRLKLALSDWNVPFVTILVVIVGSPLAVILVGVFLLDAIPKSVELC